MHAAMLYPVRKSWQVSLAATEIPEIFKRKRCVMVTVMVGPEDDDGPEEDK